MIKFRCLSCGYLSKKYINKCPFCQSSVVVERKDLIWKIDKGLGSIWRYRKLLPPVKRIISLGEGYTPIKRIDSVLIKDETKNPTRTFIDRGVSVYVSYLPERKNIIIPYIMDFTVSISTYLTSSNVNTKVIAESTNIDPIEALYLADMGVEIEFSNIRRPIGNLKLSYDDPLMMEGYKTISYEIFEQSWKYSPDGIVIPSEKGFLAYSIIKGFLELDDLLDLDYLPEMIITLSKDMSVPSIIKNLQSIRLQVEYVDSTDALKAMLKLAKRGIYVKPLSAMAYNVAETYKGKYIALISGSSLRKLMKRSRYLTELQGEILNIFKNNCDLTAYKVWECLGKKYSLQGVYRALDKLVRNGYLDKSMKMRGKRKVSIYNIRS